MTLETQIEHANRKIETTSKLIVSVEKDGARQQTTVNNLERDLRDTEEAAEDAAGESVRVLTWGKSLTLNLADFVVVEKQRTAAQARGTAFSAADLEEYRRLYVCSHLAQ